jgi:hypothetical protein
VEVQLPSVGGEDELPVSVAMSLLWEGSALVVAVTALPLGCVLEEQDKTVVVTEVTDGAGITACMVRLTVLGVGRRRREALGLSLPVWRDVLAVCVRQKAVDSHRP